MESFQSGSPSLLPLLSRIKSESPDVFVVQGFPADDILIVKQSREIDLSPKLVMLPELFPKDKYGGAPVDYLVGSATWISESTYPDSVSWLASFRKLYPDRPEPQEWAPLGYTAMKMMLTAIADVGPAPEAIIHRLETVKMDSPFGPVSFHDSHNSHHQVLSQLNIIQYQDGKRLVIYPPDLAGETRPWYPEVPWTDRKN